MVSLTKRDIELALDQIDRDGIPSRNRSTGYCLIARGKCHYPPKHVLRVAYKSKIGVMPKGLRGGPSVNTRLELLDYVVKKHDCRNDNIRIAG